MGFVTVHPAENNVAPTEYKYASKSLGWISIESPFRKWLIRLVTPGSHFDTFILTMIILNSITMACVDYRQVDSNYEPISTDSWRNRTIEIAEVVFMVIFIFECVMKIIAFGLIGGREAYLKSSWNAFDFIIVMFR